MASDVRILKETWSCATSVCVISERSETCKNDSPRENIITRLKRESSNSHYIRPPGTE